MLVKLDRYLLRSCLGLFAGLTVLALALLLLERLIRIIEIVSGSTNTAVAAGMMVANLIPHYLDLALPGAFLIAMIITIDRLSRSGEIVALMATGVSLYRIVMPYLGLAVMLAVLSLFISGFLQPLSRYNYRQIVHDLQHKSVVTAFQERKFVQLKDRIVWTDHVDSSKRNLGQTFILETEPNGARHFLTGQTGELKEAGDGTIIISLNNGAGGTFRNPDESTTNNLISYSQLSWPMPTSDGEFRERGEDERELVLPELIAASNGAGSTAINPVLAVASFHDRLSRAALLLILPLIGMVLGLNLGRTPRSGGIVIGILLLLSVQKLLEYGLALAESGAIPAWAGFWPVVLALAFAALIMFRRLAHGRILHGPRPIRRRWSPPLATRLSETTQT